MVINDQNSLAYYHHNLFKIIPQVLATIIMNKVQIKVNIKILRYNSYLQGDYDAFRKLII